MLLGLSASANDDTPSSLPALIPNDANPAAEPRCEAPARITHEFANGARWDFCYASRIRENLVLSDVFYTPPDDTALRVLSSARLSQLHVAYDDSDVTYNDVTQYGLGGGYLLTLTTEDCPGGTLLDVQTRPAICLTRSVTEAGFHTPSQSARADNLHLFSVSQVGAYAYIVSWTFYDDGAFEPGVGATGALQRNSDDLTAPYGRVLQGDPDTLWLSHTHNYYWRLDFDLGDSATDDVISEWRYTPTAGGLRQLDIETFDIEQARQIQPSMHQLWRIMEHGSDDARGYQIEPVRNGHRFERSDVEPYTEYDFFVTVANDCERFASQNARFNPDCLNNVLQYVDGESLNGADLVAWNRVSFHHTPRSEDQRHMHTHWDDFKITPVNVLRSTSALSIAANRPPVFEPQSNRQTNPDNLIHGNIVATDPDGDVLSYAAEGLPPGLEMRLDGHVHGYPEREGSYTVTVTARDDVSHAETTFTWVVGDVNAVEKRPRTGHSGFMALVVLVCFGLGRRRLSV